MRSSNSGQCRGRLFATTAAVVASFAAATAAVPANSGPTLRLSADPTGIIATLDVTGPVDESGEFFQSLGTMAAAARPATRRHRQWG